MFTKDGRLAVAYYDRQYGDDEITGFSDYSVSGSDDLRDFGFVRATSSSMPPPTQFSGTFFGDYAGLSAYDNKAHPLLARHAQPGADPVPRRRHADITAQSLHDDRDQRQRRERPGYFHNGCECAFALELPDSRAAMYHVIPT